MTTSTKSLSSSSPLWGSTTATTTMLSLGVGVVTGACLVLQLQRHRRLLPQQPSSPSQPSQPSCSTSTSTKLSGSSASNTDAGTTNTNRFYYLDYNGTTPVYEEVYDAMVPYFKVRCVCTTVRDSSTNTKEKLINFFLFFLLVCSTRSVGTLW